MSYAGQPIPPDTPADILDKSFPIDPDYVEWDKRLGRGFARKPFDKCLNCQVQNPVGAKNCKRCGRSAFETFYPPEEISFNPDGVSAHTRRQLTVCKVTTTDPGTGQNISHRLNEKTRLVVSLANEEAHTETYCGTCGFVYTWSDGRKATAEEMEGCRNGKIPAKQVKKTVDFNHP